jgi:protein translocase SecG subunit
MTVFSLLAVSFVMNVVGILFIICAVALILVILIQKGRGGGLSSAFGGGMASGLLGYDSAGRCVLDSGGGYGQVLQTVL